MLPVAEQKNEGGNSGKKNSVMLKIGKERGENWKQRGAVSLKRNLQVNSLAGFWLSLVYVPRSK